MQRSKCTSYAPFACSGRLLCQHSGIPGKGQTRNNAGQQDGARRPFAQTRARVPRCVHLFKRTAVSPVRARSFRCYPSTPTLNRKMAQPLVAGGGCGRHNAGRVCLRNRGKRDRCLGVRGQPCVGGGYPPGGIFDPRGCYIWGGGALADKGEGIWVLGDPLMTSCVVR